MILTRHIHIRNGGDCPQLQGIMSSCEMPMYIDLLYAKYEMACICFEKKQAVIGCDSFDISTYNISPCLDTTVLHSVNFGTRAGAIEVGEQTNQ